MMQSIRKSAVWAMVFSGMISIASALAQQENPITVASSSDACPACAEKLDARPSLRHVLNGHAFLPSLFIPTEFVDTRATLGITVGYGNYDAALLGTSTNVKLGAFAPGLDVQVLLTDWLGISAGLTGNAIAGLNASSVLQYGGSVAYTWRFGLIGRLFRTDSSYLSTAFEVDRPHILAVSPLESAIQKVQQYIGSSAPQFPTNGVETAFRPSLRFAHGFNSVLGLRSFLGFNFQTGEELSQKRTGNQMTFGLGLSSDLFPATQVPIGLTANYRRNQIISGGASNEDVFEFGLYETVSTRFNFGAEIGFNSSNKVDTTIVGLVARGYFN
jgi:hypothetical protein